MILVTVLRCFASVEKGESVLKMAAPLEPRAVYSSGWTGLFFSDIELWGCAHLTQLTILRGYAKMVKGKSFLQRATTINSAFSRRDNDIRT